MQGEVHLNLRILTEGEGGGQWILDNSQSPGKTEKLVWTPRNNPVGSSAARQVYSAARGFCGNPAVGASVPPLPEVLISAQVLPGLQLSQEGFCSAAAGGVCAVEVLGFLGIVSRSVVSVPVAH